MNDLSEGFKGCPFCGAIPEVSNTGSCLDIDCCVGMSFQKSDILDEKFNKRFELDMNTLKYSDDLENVIIEYAKEIWNTRVDV